MPGPMPPPGAPPQGAPPPPDAAQPPQDPGQGDGISKLMMNVDQAIDHLSMVIGQSKAASPQEKQMITQIDQVYGQLMDSLGISGGGDDEAPPGPGGQGQTVPPEAGGNKGAIPSPQ